MGGKHWTPHRTGKLENEKEVYSVAPLIVCGVCVHFSMASMTHRLLYNFKERIDWKSKPFICIKHLRHAAYSAFC